MPTDRAILISLVCAVGACSSDASPDDACEPTVAVAPICHGDGCRIAQVSGGFRFSCARRENGQVLCWGENRSGNLGDGTQSCWTTPRAGRGRGFGDRRCGAPFSRVCDRGRRRSALLGSQ